MRSSWPTRPTGSATVTPPPDGVASSGEVPVDRTGALLREGAELLASAGSETPRLDAELLLGHAVGAGRTVVLAHPEAPVGPDAVRRYRADLDRRATGEPVAYLRGLKEFYGLAFEADPRALIPRPETERLVELADAEVMRRLGYDTPRAESAPLRLVDVGTGSGAIAVALGVALRKVQALEAVDILATDISPDALGLARENAVAHAVADHVRFAEADLLPAGEPAPFDIVLANLPYVRTEVIATLPRATSFEPVLALDGGPDGLAVIERLLALLPGALAADGVALLEISADQGEEIGLRVAERLPGWVCSVEADLAGLPRVARVTRG